MTNEPVEVQIATTQGAVLNYLVAIADGCTFENVTTSLAENWTHNYCTDPAQALPIIERLHAQGLLLQARPETKCWTASIDTQNRFYHGPTAVIAAMRCYAVMKLGETAQVPARLLTA